MVDRFEHFVFVINEISKVFRKVAGQEMEKHGLKFSHSIYFLVLARSEETGFTAAQLCEYSGKDKADVSRMLAHMEKEGLVVKECVNQSYKGTYKLTEKGQQIADYVKQRAAKTVEIAGRDLTKESRQNLYTALDSIVVNLQELSEKGFPEE